MAITPPLQQVQQAPATSVPIAMETNLLNNVSSGDPTGGLAQAAKDAQAQVTKANAAYDTDRAGLESAFAARSVEGDDAARWAALAKGFSQPAANFWMSLANAGAEKGQVIAQQAADNIARQQEMAKLRYAHSAKVSERADTVKMSIDEKLAALQQNTNDKLAAATSKAEAVQIAAASSLERQRLEGLRINEQNELNRQNKLDVARKPIWDAVGQVWRTPPNADGTDGGIVGGNAAAGVDNSGLSGQAFLETLSPTDQNKVVAVSEGRLALPPQSRRNPEMIRLANQVMQYDPEFDAVDYNKRYKTAVAFSSGKQGDVMRAINQTLQHAGTMDRAIDTLDNVNTSYIGLPSVENAVRNIGGEATGQTSQNTFRETQQALASELRKVFAGSGGGTLEELRSWEKAIPLNAPKDAQKKYLAQGVELLHGAMDAIDNQYKQGMGSSRSILTSGHITPGALAIYNKLTTDPTAPALSKEVVAGASQTLKEKNAQNSSDHPEDMQALIRKYKGK